jgi:protease-4
MGPLPPQQHPLGPPPPSPYGWGAPPPPTNGRNRYLPFLVGLIAVVVTLGFLGLSLVASMSGSGSTSSFGSIGFGDKIGVLHIEGALGEGPGFEADTKRLVSQVQTWTENKSIKAIVLRINSPGGAVSATQDLFHALNQFRATERPIVASMGDIAASGGYYAAMAADEVYANEGSLTGSIGVIMSFVNMQGLQEKIGINFNSIKSGEFKDLGSASRPMTPEEEALLNEMIQDVYVQFLDAVVAARGEQVRELLAAELNISAADVAPELVRAHIKSYADGRIFTGRQGFQYGLVDSLGTLDQAIERAAQLANIDPKSTNVAGPPSPQQGLFGVVSNLATQVQRLPNAGGFKVEYRVPWN